MRHLRRNIPPYINSFRRRYQGGRANDRPGASEEDELAAGAGAADDDELDDGTSASCSEHGVDGADAKEQLHRSFEGEQHEQCIAASRHNRRSERQRERKKKRVVVLLRFELRIPDSKSDVITSFTIEP